jgi:ABC-type lipoprotein release transport system permease subunit
MSAMKLNRLVFASLRYYLTSHLGVLAGASISAAVLIGALAVGDSVRISLRNRALDRLAGATAVISTGDRYFNDTLGERIRAVQLTNLPNLTGTASILLELPGMATRQDATARANSIHVLGIPDGFLVGLGPIDADKVWLNASLARQLKAEVGDEVVVRVHKPTALSRDAVISPRDTVAVALRLRVAGIVSAHNGGDLALQAGQTPPMNAFVSRSTLANAASLAGRGNLVWFRAPEGPEDAASREEWIDELTTRLHAAWSLDDAELSLRPLTANQQGLELTSRRIFLDHPVSEAALKPFDSVSGSAQPVLTYLVNALIAGQREAPYAMVTSIGSPWTPESLADDEMVLNRWLADDLRLKVGDSLEMVYYVADTGPQLVERTNKFRIRGIVPLEGIHADRTLMPEFPGIAKAESTQDWDAGFPLVRKIRNEDEAYWKKWRGTPKAFISLTTGQKLWGNRFGDLTAIRWSTVGTEKTNDSLRLLSEEFKARLKPESFGLRIDPVRTRLLTAAAEGQDFGGLFLSFSFFLLGSSLLLTALLFRFALERRAREMGILLALGWTPGRVSGLFWREGFALAILGTVLGSGLGVVYARGVLWGLATVWSSAVARASLEFHLTGQTFTTGVILSLAVAAATLGVTLRKLVRRTARELMADGALDLPAPLLQRTSRVWTALLFAIGLSSLGMTSWALVAGQKEPGIFFGAGFLWLLTGVFVLRVALRRWSHPLQGGINSTRRTGFMGLALRSVTRRPSRSLGGISLLASAAFLLCAVGAFKLEESPGAGRPESGTGGFGLWARTALPLLKDLNTPEGRDFYGISATDLQGTSIVAFRVHDGDDASCLNLARPQRPRLLGVPAEELARRGAFSFAELVQSSAVTNGWLALSPSEREPGETPAIGDASSLQWILHKQVGDTLDYVDEQGRPFKLRLVGSLEGSVLQGNLLISESELIRRFPGETGHREFLIQTPQGRESTVSATLSRGLQDVGFEATPTWERLGEFNAVQNTYLDTFQLLGGLGLLLGCAGFGVIVLRNLQERRGELALMLAIGFERGYLIRLAILENGTVLALGLGSGIVASIVAVAPSLRPGGPPLPWASLIGMMVLVAVTGLLSTIWAAWKAVHERLLDSLRDL